MVIIFANALDRPNCANLDSPEGKNQERSSSLPREDGPYPASRVKEGRPVCLNNSRRRTIGMRVDLQPRRIVGRARTPRTIKRQCLNTEPNTPAMREYQGGLLRFDPEDTRDSAHPRHMTGRSYYDQNC